MLNVFLKGLIIGIAKILPGVSGAILAMSFGLYEIIVNSLTSLKYALEKRKVLIPLSLGIFISIIVTSQFLNILIMEYYYIVLSFIIGVMAYELLINLITYKNKKINTKYIIISIIIVLFLSSLFLIKGKSSTINSEYGLHSFISLFLCGILDAFATIIPGISGSALLLLVGYYQKIIGAFSLFDLSILIPFSVGFIISIIIFSKIISHLFKKYRELFNYLITAISIWSIIILLIKLINEVSLNRIFSITITLICGFIFTKRFSQ